MIAQLLFGTLMFTPPGTTPATVTLPAEIVLASVSYSDHPGAKWAGTLSFASRLPAPAGCYSYTSVDLGRAVVNGKQTFAQSTRSGGACQIPQLSFGPVSLFVLVTGGVTVANATALPSGAVGGLVDYRIKKGPWGIWGDYQDSNTTGKTGRVGVRIAWGK